MCICSYRCLGNNFAVFYDRQDENITLSRLEYIFPILSSPFCLKLLGSVFPIRRKFSIHNSLRVTRIIQTKTINYFHYLAFPTNFFQIWLFNTFDYNIIYKEEKQLQDIISPNFGQNFSKFQKICGEIMSNFQMEIFYPKFRS